MRLVGTALNLGEKMNIYPQSADVLHVTSNLAISRCFGDDGKKMDKGEKRTCRACKSIVFAHSIRKFVTFSFLSLHKLLSNQAFQSHDHTCNPALICLQSFFL